MQLDRPGRTLLIWAMLVAVMGVATPPAALAAAQKTKTKTCGQTAACSTSLSSSATAPSGGGGGGGGGAILGGGGPPAPTGSAPRPPAAFSTFEVSAMPRQTQRIQAGSKLIEALNPGRKLVCPGYTRRDKSWFEFELTAKTRFGVIYEVTDTIHNVTAKGLRFCAGLGYRFKTFSGRPARRAKLPDGTLGFVGLLPACTEEDSPGEAVASGPCVSSIDEVKRSGKVTTTIHALIPAKAQTDPWGAG